ncbi:EH domain-containing protein 1-like [Trifolium medium]|uniref:EH domain-containing protein 1-like n=1 Tax=Trifolium medium TaxID=97028 RepID=A0A392QZ42_9FABA|nr:EH domain-containing protein 1-like [Trifolium medium]
MIAVDKENVKPPVIEGLDTLVAQTKSLTITPPPEVNVTPQPRPFLPNSWFTSKSSKKVSLVLFSNLQVLIDCDEIYSSKLISDSGA